MEGAASNIVFLLGFSGNIASSISTVILNKLVFETAGSKCPGSLAVLHLFVTFALSDVCARVGMFVPKRVSGKPVLVLGLANALCLLFLNLSLNFNSVGVFQVTKLSCIPASVLVERVLQDKRHSGMLLSSLALLLTGVSMVVVSDVRFNALGAVFAVLSIVAILLCQNFTSAICRDNGLTSIQMVHVAFLPSAIMMVPVGLISDFCVDALPSLTARSVLLSLSSAFTAFFVNLTTTYILRVSSPLTYQVLGQIKTVLTLVMSHIVFWTVPTPASVLGYLCAIAGACGYAKCKLDEQSPSMKPDEKRS